MWKYILRIWYKFEYAKTLDIYFFHLVKLLSVWTLIVSEHWHTLMIFLLLHSFSYLPWILMTIGMWSLLWNKILQKNTKFDQIEDFLTDDQKRTDRDERSKGWILFSIHNQINVCFIMIYALMQNLMYIRHIICTFFCNFLGQFI